jgi:hypothetical protein
MKLDKFRIVGEFFVFLREYKEYWMIPIVMVLLLMGLLIVLTEGTAFSPFIYALF